MYKKLSMTLLAVILSLSITSLFYSNIQAQNENQLDAVIVGLPELIPGTTSIINISIQNNKNLGQNGALAHELGISNYYGSAVGLTAVLKPNNAPVEILTEKSLIGTLPSGVATPTIPFVIKIKKDAVPGFYNMAMELSYSDLYDIDTSNLTPELKWADEIETRMLEIEIKEEPTKFEITNVEPSLQPGMEREIKVTFVNTGNEVARNSIAKISVDYPLSVIDDTAFLADIKPDEPVAGLFKIRIKGEAIAKEYPLDIQIKYTDSKDDVYITKSLKHSVEVIPVSSVINIKGEYFIGGIIGAAFIGLIWLIWFLVRMKPINIDKE